jgi:hypothetical protein
MELHVGWFMTIGRGRGLVREHARVARLVGLAVLVVGVAQTSAASAATYTWSGESSTTAQWSAGANWEGASVPSAPAALVFPRLTRPVCSEANPTQPCYISEDNMASLSAESVQVDDGDEYGIFGEQLTVGSGGLTVAPAAGSSGPAGDLLELPIVLGADQKWTVVGHESLGEKGVIFLGKVSGAHALTVEMTERPAVIVPTEVEVGSVAIEGHDKSAGAAENGIVVFEGDIDYTDSNPVTLSHIGFVGSGSLGALATVDSEFLIGNGQYPEEGIRTASATFDSESNVVFSISGPNTVAGGDYSELVSSGAVELGGAKLAAVVAPPSEGKGCPSLSPGDQYTLVSSAGALSGSFANAPEGAEIPLVFAKGCQQIHQFLKIAYNRTGPTQTVTGTVVAGETSTTSLAIEPANAVTNQVVTFTATVGTSAGVPNGTVEFRDGANPISGCETRPVASTGPSYAATCQTSFAASLSRRQITAAFTPGPRVNLKPSVSGVQELTVNKARTTTSIEASNSSPIAGSSVIYTATVSPQASGTVSVSGAVTFLEDGSPVSGCAGQVVTGGSAMCIVSYPEAAKHNVIARYAGSGDFESSESSALSVSVLPANSPKSPLLAPVPQVSLSGVVWLAASKIAVDANGRATVKLGCEGIDACNGKIEIQIKQTVKKRKGKQAVRTIDGGEASFSITGSTTAGVAIRLNETGRAALKKAHGRLTARLLISQPNAKQDVTVHLLERSSSRRH